MRSPAARLGRLRSTSALATSLALGLATLPASAFAAEPPAPTVTEAPSMDATTTAILPLVVEGDMPEGDRTALTEQLVDGLQRGNFEVVTPDQVTAAAGGGDCSKPGCMQKIADATDATHIVRVQVEVVDRDYTVTVQLYDGSDGSTVITTSDGCEICGVADVGELLETQAATLRTKLDALASGPASIVIRSNPDGADVTLDGEVFGTTPLDKPIIPGDHVIRVSKEGYIAVQEKRTFVEGARESLDYELEKVANRLPKRPWGWASLGVGLTLVAGAGLTAGLVHGRVPYTLGGACDEADRDKFDGQNCAFLWDTMAISLPAGIVGGALTTLGVAILLSTSKKTRKRDKAEDVANRIRVNGAGIGIAF